MKSRIDELLLRYWEGESTLEEEKELKLLLREAEGFDQEKTYFGMLGEYAGQEPVSLSIPKKKSRLVKIQWMAWAASLALLISSVWIWRDYEQQKEEREAYEEVMQALAMIQTNLEKGQKQMMPLNDLKYLNTTNQLFQQKP